MGKGIPKKLLGFGPEHKGRVLPPAHKFLDSNNFFGQTEELMQSCSQEKYGSTEDHSSSILYNSSILANSAKVYGKRPGVVNFWKKAKVFGGKMTEIDKKKKMIRQQLDCEAREKEEALKSMLVKHANSITVLDKNFGKKSVFVNYKIREKSYQRSFDKS